MMLLIYNASYAVSEILRNSYRAKSVPSDLQTIIVTSQKTLSCCLIRLKAVPNRSRLVQTSLLPANGLLEELSLSEALCKLAVSSS